MVGAGFLLAALVSGCASPGETTAAASPSSDVPAASGSVPVPSAESSLPPAAPLGSAVGVAPQSAPPQSAPASARKPAPTPSSPPSFAEPHVSAIRAEGPCRLNDHTYEADFVITLAGGQGWQIRPQSTQQVRPDGTSLTYRYGLIFPDLPPAPESLVDGRVRVTYPLGDDGMQVIALADGSVHAVVVPADLKATATCAP